MLFKNAYIFTEAGEFIHGSFRVADGKFTEILDTVPAEEGVDLAGQYVIPGLIDVHNHGNSGADFSDGDYEGLVKMARYLAANGITSFAPASMTLPYEVLEKAFATAVRITDEQPEGCARLMGIQMEGPFFSEKKKGAQNGAYLKDPDFAAFKKLYDGCRGLVRIADVAPELPGAVEFTREAAKLCTVSIAHTDANYEEADAVLEAGATHLTHLYNAMPPIHHRKPGVIGAGSERENVIAELICDGEHVHPSSVRMAFKLFPGRICLVLMLCAAAVCPTASMSWVDRRFSSTAMWPSWRTAPLPVPSPISTTACARLWSLESPASRPSFLPPSFPPASWEERRRSALSLPESLQTLWSALRILKRRPSIWAAPRCNHVFSALCRPRKFVKVHKTRRG